MSRVLVIGASRGIGLATVAALLAAGHEVRALARSAHAIAIDDPRLDKRDGDALRPADIETALDGVDAVVQAVGVAAGPVLITGTTLFSKSTRVLVDAMKAKGVRRLVAVTGLGAGDSRGRGGALYDLVLFPLLLKRIYDDKDVQEQIIRASGLEWTILRPGLLTDGPATGTARVLVDPKDWTGGRVSRADVARVIAAELAEGRHVGRTPLVIQ
ncbi:MAG: SDR family NAD(P)-dependent oxidoreductase [Pseudomonadota bacterium]